MKTIDEMKIEETLALLRKRWVDEPANRPIIVRMARAQEIRREMLEKKKKTLFD